MASSSTFPVFSAGKKFFSKMWLSHVLSIANTHLWAKIQKKLMIKSRENAKKLVFPAFFGRKKILLENRAASHFRHYHFPSECANSHEKIWSTAREIQEILFSGENRLFWRFLESSGFKNQLYWQLNHGWWWALL